MMSATIQVLFFLLIPFAYSIAQPPSIHEEKFVSLGGVEQWITISGADKSKPVVLIVHGGPGSVLSPYANAIYQGWEKDFILVNWDQRGAGRTFGRNAPQEVGEDYWLENPLTVDQFVNDGIALTKYLLQYLDKQKVILMGTSWGSIIGAKMALGHPELFHAYLGHAQFVNFHENLKFAYETVYRAAKGKRDTTSLRKLEAFGKPPYDDARNLGRLLRIVKHYENAASTPAPEHWWQLDPAYDNERDHRNRYDGDDYSFLYFAGHGKLGIKPMASHIDLAKNGLVFKIPVYLIQGKHDILTSKTINKPYYDRIRAPEKNYVVVPDAGHAYNRSVVDKQYQIVKELFSNETGTDSPRIPTHGKQ